MNLPRLIGLFICSILITLPVYSEESASSAPASPESIRKLMNSTGSGDLSMQMMSQLLPVLKQMIPEASDQFWDEVMAEINPDEMIELVIPVYQKYLTEEEILAINAFNNSPVGQKLITVQPDIMQETMVIGQQWGENLANSVIKKFQEQQEPKK